MLCANGWYLSQTLHLPTPSLSVVGRISSNRRHYGKSMRPHFMLYTTLPSSELYYGKLWVPKRRRNISLESLDLNLRPARSRIYNRWQKGSIFRDRDCIGDEGIGARSWRREYNYQIYAMNDLLQRMTQGTGVSQLDEFRDNFIQGDWNSLVSRGHIFSNTYIDRATILFHLANNYY